MPNKDLYKVIHSEPEKDTVYKYVSAPDSPANSYANDLKRFLSIKGEDKLTNGERIISSLKTDYERKPLIDAGIISSNNKILNPSLLPLKVGTILYLEYDKVNAISFLTEGLEVVSTDDVAFKAAKLAELEADNSYVQLIKPVYGEFQRGTVKESFPSCTVWIWCRSLSSKKDESGELQGEILDLTPFIQKVISNVDRNGGNFQIQLPPLVCDLDSDRKWKLRKGNLIQYENKSGVDEYTAEGSLFEEDGISIRRNQFFFNNAIKSNDLIFIRFETLELEKEQRYKDSKNYYIDKSQLPNRIYDMIGLVDSTSIATNPSSNDVSINISGRDLSKLFLEDGTYFYGLESKAGVINVAGNSSLKSSILNRTFAEKGMQFIGLYNFTSIEQILKFIIQQLASIKIVPNELFEAYGDKRNKKFNEVLYTGKVGSKNGFAPPYKEAIASGIWQILKLVVDKSVSQRRLADTSFSTAQGCLMNFIQSAVQMPLCEAYMDTYGDQYHLIVRKPPYDQKSLISLIEGKVNTEEENDVNPAIIDIEEDDVLQEILMMDDSQVYSWYSFYPKGALINSSVDYSTFVIPAIFFDEYAQVFGSKPFQQSHPYVPYVPMSFDNEFGNLLYEQAYSDMKYVIESSQYLPFSRKGTIVLNGDRRLKIGNIIRYKPTGEIFFINGVQQNFQISENVIDRTTTIQVSRGLVEQFIYGLHLVPEDGSDKKVFISYFNLIDTRLNLVYKDKSVPVTKEKKIGTKTVVKESFALMDNPNQLNAGESAGDGLVSPHLVKGINYLKDYDQFPETKAIFIKFINAINKAGYAVIITSGIRDAAKQARLKLLNKHNAAAGNSKHEVGRAIDLNITDVKSGKRYWSKSSEAEWRSTGVPQIANSLGLKWAGNNDGTFGIKGTSNYWADRVHFEVIGSLTKQTVTEDVYEEFTAYQKLNRIDTDAVFRNYKVNQFTFNFFLKNLQFDPKYKEVKSKKTYNSDQEGTANGSILTGENLPPIKIAAKRKKVNG